MCSVPRNCTGMTLQPLRGTTVRVEIAADGIHQKVGSRTSTEMCRASYCAAKPNAALFCAHHAFQKEAYSTAVIEGFGPGVNAFVCGVQNGPLGALSRIS